MKDEIIKNWEDFVQDRVQYVDTIKDKDVTGEVTFWTYREDMVIPFTVDSIDPTYLLCEIDEIMLAIKTFRDTDTHFNIQFKDDDSYPAGRYLSVDKASGVIDFNYSCNLLCAYSDRYTCMVPENIFPANCDMKVGEKNFIRKRQSDLEIMLRKTTAFNIGKKGTRIMINPKNTDRQISVDENTPVSEIIDLIWGEGVEKGEKETMKDINAIILDIALLKTPPENYYFIAGPSVVEQFMAEMEIHFNNITDEKEKAAIYKKHKGLVAQGGYEISSKTGIKKL